MMKLIQTSVASIIYGEDNEELFRCPRQLDNIDLRNYVNDNRCFLGLESDNTKDTRNVPGKRIIGCYRMYFVNGRWNGRWFVQIKEHSDRDICYGMDNIVKWFSDNFPNGCTWEMREYMEKRFGNKKDYRWLVKPAYSDNYKILVDTEYFNEDYPLRIYCYMDK